MNIQVIATPDRAILWISEALPGRSHDLTAARVWGILRELRCCPHEAGHLCKVMTVLQSYELARG